MEAAVNQLSASTETLLFSVVRKLWEGLHNDGNHSEDLHTFNVRESKKQSSILTENDNTWYYKLLGWSVL